DSARGSRYRVTFCLYQRPPWHPRSRHLCPAAMATTCEENTIDQDRSADGSLHGHWHQLDPSVIGAPASEPFIHDSDRTQTDGAPWRRRVCPPALAASSHGAGRAG